MNPDAQVFTEAARAFVALVRRIPSAAWDGPGLGDWDVRALVGHTSRSLITVLNYLQAPAERVDVNSAPEYYAIIKSAGATLGGSAAEITARGVKAGADLGDSPVERISELLDEVVAALAVQGNPTITVVGGLGIRLNDYLPTRTFELAVHSRDIARAVGLTFELPAAVLSAATTLAAQIAVAEGSGGVVLDALSGRTTLPGAFSVV